jgi:thioredoxin reductase (NADPH)
MNDYDVVVIGAGMAGLSAALIASQHGLRTMLVEQMGPAGQVLNVERIENMPGFPDGIAGFDLGPIVHEQAAAAGAEFAMDTVTAIEPAGETFVVRCDGGDMGASTVIIATGSHFRTLGVPGEADFEGKGISHCASCDGHLFAGEAVAVIGGGDSAVEEASVLSEHVERVVLLHPGETLEAQRYLLDAFESKPNVAVQPRTAVQEILGGDGLVTGLRVRDEASGSVREESVTGVFIFTGLAPNTAFLDGLVELDNGGHVVVDLGLQTSVPGIFAAGDVRQHSASLVASAIGDGATAAVSASRYLRGRTGR